MPRFLDDGDRLRDLQLLRDALHKTRCVLHAYVLMDIHVHLLLTPPTAHATEQLTSGWAQRRRLVQRPPRVHRHLVGSALQSLSGGQRRVPPALLSLHLAQSVRAAITNRSNRVRST
ncbi:hypothetical protein PJ250_09855 [Pseudoxanthomonas sp. JBR18]|nr:hypothetical protein [Pseudoxanthomonas sp. JBR18]WCE06407.1 hypothetical protein PJ250_09855 [Pseudoxanthomonas sp. JBR18]